MRNKSYQLNDSLTALYDDIRTELGFHLSLPKLVANRAVWRADIAGSLKHAYGHLLRATHNELTYTEQIDRFLQADLFIRDLLERLLGELTEYHTEDTPTKKTRSTRRYRTNRSPVAAESADTNCAEDSHNTETQSRLFTRKGTDIQVIVDHVSETNFFADISYDLHSGGLFVATYDILNVGTRLNVRLVLPGKHSSFQLHGTVSWIREADNCAEDVSPGMGITFRKLHREPSRAIQQFMSMRPPLLFEMA